jgi:hypothetical protein
MPASQTQARRDFIAVVGETTANGCFENRQMQMLDATIETQPFSASSFTVPVEPRLLQPRRPLRHAFLEQNFTPIYYKRVLFLAHFSAGVRAVDIRDPFNPKEIVSCQPSPTRPTSCVGTGADRRAKSRSDEQRRGRRPRLHLHRRSREHHAHSRAHRRRPNRQVLRCFTAAV